MSSETKSVRDQILKRFMKKTSKSMELNQKAKRVLPGGGTRNVANFYPYPLYSSHGKGYNLYDVDGNEYIDCNNNMHTLIHGHVFPPIVEAIKEQAEKGTAYATSTQVQMEFAELLVDRVSSLDEIRFCASGSEATMFPLRLSRVASNHEKIIKLDGSYHGSTDYVQTNVCADYTSENPPQLYPELGFPAALHDQVLITPINDTEYLKQLILKHKNDIAAMIVEPVINRIGMQVTKKYIKAVRDITQEYGIHLIFDEVITFRHALGGFQEILEIEPELTSFGKCIGGGLPIGAFGGNSELMELFNPSKEPYIHHSGSFNGNILSMVAGKTALEHYTQTEINKIESLGIYLQESLDKLIMELGIAVHTSRVGSLVYFHIFNEPYSNARDYGLQLIPNYPTLRYLHLELMNQGLYLYQKNCMEFILSTIMDKSVVDTILEKTRKALE
jgi:glutamate-1-semialdehyde 2,1-aminomutase